jgi:hypothetical protein
MKTKTLLYKRLCLALMLIFTVTSCGNGLSLTGDSTEPAAVAGTSTPSPKPTSVSYKYRLMGAWEGAYQDTWGGLFNIVLEIYEPQGSNEFPLSLLFYNENGSLTRVEARANIDKDGFRFEVEPLADPLLIGAGMEVLTNRTYYSFTYEGDEFLNGTAATECFTCSIFASITLNKTSQAPGRIDQIVSAQTIDMHTPLAPIFFNVVVIVDTTSEPVTRDQAQSLVSDASNILFGLTPIGVYMTDFREDNNGGAITEIVSRYVSSVSDPSLLPNGIIIFSYGDNDFAKQRGGYAITVQGPAGFRNEFNSPIVGSDKLYVGVVHFSHRFAECGYGGTDTIQSAVSIGGECRNQPGIACTMFNGYSMCSTEVNHLYASTPTYFGATTIVHEIMHSFGPNGDYDHFGTVECNRAMGWPDDYFEPALGAVYNQMCPFVYENFTASYQP